MPIVHRSGRQILTYDVNEEILEQWNAQPWNAEYDRKAKPLQVTFGNAVPDVDQADQKLVRKYIHRHWERNNEKGYFMKTPVYRACIEDWNLYNQVRFMHRFINEAKYGPHGYIFEPDLYDVRIDEVGDTAGLHMPIWILDFLIGQNYLELAEKITKLPGVPEMRQEDKCSDSRMTSLFKDLYVRRKQENPMELYENYSQTEEFQELEKELAEFNLQANEAKALNLNLKEDEPKKEKSKATKTSKPKTKTTEASTIELDPVV